MTDALTRKLASLDDTLDLADALGSVLRAGDVVLLSGQIGAGKTFFARALIQSLQDIPEDVPSPSFTLVQVYDTQSGEIWHSDLYRLADPDQCIELGLTEAFDTAINLVEWPDRLGDLTPDTALHLEFSIPESTNNLTMDDASEDTQRQVTLTWQNDSWRQRIKAIL